jgi:hypothetical protein
MGRSVALRANSLELLADLERLGAITRTYLLLPEDITFDRYEALYSMVGEWRDSTCWLIGDLINQGEKVFGHTYAQASEATGLHPQTLMNYASVCSHIPRSRRRPPSVLKFGVHAEVAYLPPKEQEHWLTEAERNGWGRSRLREALQPVREMKGTAKTISTSTEAPEPSETPTPGSELLPPAGDETTHICQCPSCGRYHRIDKDVMT